MSLTEDMKLWRQKFDELSAEYEQLAAKAEELEQQNQLLQEQISKEGLRNRGLEELSAIYDDGYHICHAGFGRPREGEDCLFCLSFLHAGGRR